MANRHLRSLSADDIYARWQENFERIRLELTHLFSVRRKFMQVQTMFRENPRLNAMGSQAWEWLLLLWGRDAVMAVRRELDDDTNTISLGALLDEMASRPEVLNRRRFLAQLTGSEGFVIRMNDDRFTTLGVVSPSTDRMEDHLSPATIRGDRATLDGAAKPVLDYANRLVAHRTPVDKLAMTVSDIHAALDAMEPVVKKYHGILSGSALVAIEPVEVGDDWREVFTFPWLEPKR